MATFLILSILYFFLLPFSYLLWLKFRLKIWQALRRFVRTRIAVCNLYKETCVIFGTNIKTILDILKSDIDVEYALYEYRRIYGVSLTDVLRFEGNNGNLDEALTFLNNKKPNQTYYHDFKTKPQ